MLSPVLAPTHLPRKTWRGTKKESGSPLEYPYRGPSKQKWLAWLDSEHSILLINHRSPFAMSHIKIDFIHIVDPD